jgi:PPP family 3-phenylpropionic acid transporter
MAFRLSLFYAAIFLAIGVMLPFWPVWLQARGMSPAEIGIILSTGMWVRAFANPLVAQAADRRGRPDRMVAAMAWLALAAHAAFTVAHGFWALLLVSVVASAAFTAMMPLGDAVTMLKVREGAVDYGRVRLWGSITFIVAATVAGQALSGRPEELVLWLVIGCLVLVVAAGHSLPAVRTAGTARFAAPLVEIARDRPFLAFLGCASLLQASHGVYYGFATLHWRAAGLDELVIGALWAEGVIAEIALFAVSRRLLPRLPPYALLGLAAAGGVVRWMVLGWTTSLPALVAVQGLHGLTFGAAHLAAMHQIALAIPAAHGATAQSVYSSFATGLAMAVSMAASGWLYARFGGSAFFAMAGVSLAGAIAVAITRRRIAR